MPTREVIVIPPSEQSADPGIVPRQLRVASYSRVSTDQDEQLASFEAQKTYYTDLIMRTPEWCLAGTYADEGISGASAEKRPDFMKMIRHCKKGKIDLIITKSISRFARNTLDSIGYVRQLKAMGIGVLFEKENINTLETNSEVVLTILASLAQEELNSLSHNVKMGKRMAMKEGKVSFQYEKIYAYRRGADDTPEIIPEEAEIVRRIYTRYLAGDSVPGICAALITDGIPSPSKKISWSYATVRGILENERYCGDVILQKTFITDPISKKVKKNHGELPKIFIKNNHAPIISREIFERAQLERARRSSIRKSSQKNISGLGKYSSKYALTGILICGHCNTAYKRVTWTKNGVKKAVWRCISRLDYGSKYCRDSISIDEQSLHEAIMQAIHATSKGAKELIPILLPSIEQTLREEHGDASQKHAAEARIKELQNLTMQLIAASVSANNISENESKLQALSDEIKSLQGSLLPARQPSQTDMDLQTQMIKISDSLQNGYAVEYDDGLIRQIIKAVKVLSRDKLLILFKDGTEYEQSLSVNIRERSIA